MRAYVLLALMLTPAASTAQPRPDTPWTVCTELRPGHALTRPYYRDCRPLPAACRETPTCACLARAMPRFFGQRCRRAGHRFIRGTLALP